LTVAIREPPTRPRSSQITRPSALGDQRTRATPLCKLAINRSRHRPRGQHHTRESASPASVGARGTAQSIHHAVQQVGNDDARGACAHLRGVSAILARRRHSNPTPATRSAPASVFLCSGSHHDQHAVALSLSRVHDGSGEAGFDDVEQLMGDRRA